MVSWRKPQGSVSLSGKWGRWECHIPLGCVCVQGSHSGWDRALTSFGNWQVRMETQGDTFSPSPPAGETQARLFPKMAGPLPLQLAPWVWCLGLQRPAQRPFPVPRASSAGHPQGGALRVPCFQSSPSSHQYQAGAQLPGSPLASPRCRPAHCDPARLEGGHPSSVPCPWPRNGLRQGRIWLPQKRLSLASGSW